MTTPISNTDVRLVTTPLAARSVGIATRTLQHWTRTGLVTPTRVLPSGHARWRIDDLHAQMDRLARQRDS